MHTCVQHKMYAGMFIVAVLTIALNGNISSGCRPWIMDKSGIFIKCGMLNVGHISVEAIKWLLIT